MLATVAFLKCVYKHYEAVFSLTLTFEERIQNLAFTARFITLWHSWIKGTDGVTLQNNFMTIPGARHLVYSCHMLVVQMIVYRKFLPGRPLQAH